MPLYVLNALQITPTDGVEWAQHCFRRVPPTCVHGPKAL
jgi:hypothetical protein